MYRLERFREILLLISVPLSAYAGANAQAKLTSLALPEPLHVSLVLTSILFTFLVLRFMSVWLLWIRWIRRLILGGMYVEGTWMDVARVKGELEYIGILHFEIDGTDLSVSGENYRPDGTLESSFHSIMINFDWPSILFAWQADRPKEPRGISEVRFIKRRGGPVQYKGQFFETRSKLVDFHGWKLLRSEHLRDIDDPDRLAEIIQQIALGGPKSWEPTVPADA